MFLPFLRSHRQEARRKATCARITQAVAEANAIMDRHGPDSWEMLEFLADLYERRESALIDAVIAVRTPRWKEWYRNLPRPAVPTRQPRMKRRTA